MTTQKEKALRFKALHERDGAFIIPNPWDVGSARLLVGLGFEALATTSAGFANSLGRVDGQVTRNEVMEHCRCLCMATDIPVSADLENCFADDPAEAAETIRLAAKAGLVGGSIEDYSGDPSNPIYDFGLAVERVHAAAEAAHSLDFTFTLTARAENLLHERYDLDDTIRRLQAFEEAGADVLYAPALTTLDEVRLVTSALRHPVNVLASPLKDFTVTQLAEAGAKRISIGAALSRAAITALLRAGIEVRDQGSFAWTSDLTSRREVEKYMTGEANHDVKNPGITTMNFINEDVENFAHDHTKPESDLFRRLHDETHASMSSPQMLVGRIEGQLLKLLVQLTGARRVLEIGMFTGYSALMMAEGLPADGRLITCDINPTAAEIAQRYFDESPHGHKIEIRLGPALETITTLTEPLDLVFIDADKANYSNYHEACLPLLRSGGLIVTDNVLWSGRVVAPDDDDTRAIVAFNERVQADSRVENVCLTVRDGIMLARKN